MSKLLKGLAVVAAVIVLAIVAVPAADAAYTRDLTVGASGSDVAELQAFLVSKGFLVMPAGTTPGYFGTLTQVALGKYQAANGIAPAAGYFGPMTRAKVAGSSTSAPSSDSSSDDLSGGDGDFKNYDVRGNPDNETVEEGKTEEVFAVEFTADDSDLLVERITLVASSTSGSTTKPWKVLEEISISIDGDEVATIDASDSDAWDEDNDDVYSIDIDDVDTKVSEGDDVKLVVSVTAQDSIDDEDQGDWDISIDDDGLRAVNAEGINVYEGDIDEATSFELGEVDASTIDISFDEDDAGNEDDDVDVDDEDETEDVVLYTFTIEAQDGDVEIDEITVSLATTTNAADLEDVISELFIEVDGESFDESVDGTATSDVTIDDIGVTVSEDDEITVVVSATIEGSDDIDNWAEGMGIQVTGVSVDYIDSEDDDQTETEGSDGGELSLRSDGMMVEFVSADEDESFTADEAGEGDTGTYTIKFEVTAGDEDVYVGGVDYSYSAIADESTSTNFTAASKYEQSSGNYKVAEGKSVTFTFVLEVEAASTTPNTSVSAAIAGINWNLDDSTTTYESYDSNLDDFETDSLFLRGL